MQEWKDEMIGDAPDLVETEWDAEIDRRLRDVVENKVELVNHEESMRAARARLSAGSNRRDVA